MNKSILLSFTTLTIFGLLTFNSSAEDSTVHEAFDTAELSEKWHAAKGTWKTEDGKLRGAELPADKHTAVMTYKAPHTDAKSQFSFQFSGSETFHLSFNHPKGHLFRIALSKTQVKINTDKDKKDPKSKPVVLVNEKAAFEEGKSYQMTCESKGDVFTATIGDKTYEAKHERLAMPKTGFRFIVKGDSMIFDDFKITSLQ